MCNDNVKVDSNINTQPKKGGKSLHLTLRKTRINQKKFLYTEIRT